MSVEKYYLVSLAIIAFCVLTTDQEKVPVGAIMNSTSACPAEILNQPQPPQTPKVTSARICDGELGQYVHIVLTPPQSEALIDGWIEDRFSPETYSLPTALMTEDSLEFMIARDPLPLSCDILIRCASSEYRITVDGPEVYGIE